MHSLKFTVTVSLVRKTHFNCYFPDYLYIFRESMSLYSFQLGRILFSELIARIRTHSISEWSFTQNNGDNNIKWIWGGLLPYLTSPNMFPKYSWKISKNIQIVYHMVHHHTVTISQLFIYNSCNFFYEKYCDEHPHPQF